MSQTFHIRPAQTADHAVIVDNNIALAVESEGKVLDRDLIARGVQLVLTDPDRGNYYLAEFDRRVVGQLMITREWSDWRCGWFWWIQSVYVAPNYRRRGVYRALHHHVCEIARESGTACGVRLYVEHQNEAARRTYVQLGMRDSGYLLMETDWSNAAPDG